MIYQAEEVLAKTVERELDISKHVKRGSGLPLTQLEEATHFNNINGVVKAKGYQEES
jgi:hypothetical protein